MKISKKIMVSTAALLMSAPMATNMVNQKVQAAPGESVIKTTLTVKSPYAAPYGVRLLNEHNQFTNQIVHNGINYKVFGVATIGGRTMYRIGNQTQWIPAQYTNLNSNAIIDNQYPKDDNSKEVVTIKYVPGYSIAVWNKPTDGRITTGKLLKHNTSWKSFHVAIGNDGYIWYNLGTNQWISSKYTDAPITC